MRKFNALLWLGVVPACFFQVIGAYFYFITFAGTATGGTIYLVVKICIVIWPVFWIIITRDLSRFHHTQQWRRTCLYGIGSGALIAIVILAYGFTTLDTLRSFADNIRAHIFDLRILHYYISFAIIFSIAHAAIEEYYWRWFVFRGLTRHLAFWPAACIASIAFASHHFIVLSQYVPFGMSIIFTLFVAMAGVFWCFVYTKTQSIIGAWMSHVCVDAAIFTVGYFVLFS